MTRLKTILRQYTKNLVVLSETDDSITIESSVSALGYTTLTCNVYGDIIDITTNYHRIKAVSDLPHDNNILEIGDQMPTTWSDVYYSDMGPRVCIREDGTHYIKK